jgi:hypothetical protein
MNQVSAKGPRRVLVPIGNSAFDTQLLSCARLALRYRHRIEIEHCCLQLREYLMTEVAVEVRTRIGLAFQPDWCVGDPDRAACYAELDVGESNDVHVRTTTETGASLRLRSGIRHGFGESCTE